MNTYNNNLSPIKNENFIWVAEYSENVGVRNFLPEIEFKNGGFGHLKHSYEEINKDKLTFLGLIGSGYRFFYDINNGVFNLYDTNLELIYYDKENNEEYIFTEPKYGKYNDIIVYRTMSMDVLPGAKANVLEYGVGYKKKINDFYIEAIFHIPIVKDKSTFFTYKITSPKDINGELRIYLNGELSQTITSDLKEGYGKQFKINIS